MGENEMEVLIQGESVEREDARCITESGEALKFQGLIKPGRDLEKGQGYKTVGEYGVTEPKKHEQVLNCVECF